MKVVKKKNIRISNLDEFIELFTQLGNHRLGAFEILGELERKLNNEPTDNIIMIEYKDFGFALFESNGYTGYMSEDEPELYYFTYSGAAS